jgi:hypothetical protein
MLNHLYIPKRFIQGLTCRPIIIPSHKISPWSSQASPGNSKGKRKGKIGKINELRFQEIAAILSPLGLYGGNRKTKLPLRPNTRIHAPEGPFGKLCRRTIGRMPNDRKLA